MIIRNWIATAPRAAIGMTLAAVLLVVAACSSDGDDADAPEPVDTARRVVAADSSAPATSSPVDVAPTPSGTAVTGTAVTTSPAPAATESTAEAATRTYDFSAIDPIVGAFVEERGLNGAGLIVVDRDDGVVHEEYWGEFSADRVSLVASSSKMVAAGVLLHLDDQGLLDIDAPVADAVAWGSGNPTITPAQLVSNSSGLVGLGPDPAYAPYRCQFNPADTLQECATAVFTTPDDDLDVVPPDSEFRYGGPQWQVAGAVAEAVSGKSWAELIDEIYVQPCGLETLGFNNHFVQTQIGAGGFDYPTAFGADPSRLLDTDNPNIEGGMYTTPGDYAQLLLMHLRGGRCGDTQVLSQDALDRMHADRVGEVYDGEARAGMGYGMGWWVNRETGRIDDPGLYGAVAWLDLDGGHGAFLVTESDATTGYTLAAQLFEVVDSAVTTAT